MISLAQVSKVYPARRQAPVRAVDGVSLEVERGEFLVITGRSGAGKTTLLNLAAGLARPTSGRALFEGADLWSMPDRQRALVRNQKMGFIFQFPSLLPSLPALENVALPATFGLGESAQGVRERAADLLDLVGLSQKIEAYPRQLSAGEQQRAVIARSLVNQPEVLLCDEPTSDLDERTENDILALLARIHETRGVTIVMVTHASQHVGLGTRALEVAGGRIV